MAVRILRMKMVMFVSSRWVSMILVVLCDCVKTFDGCNDVSISLSLERDCVQGEV